MEQIAEQSAPLNSVSVLSPNSSPLKFNRLCCKKNQLVNEYDDLIFELEKSIVNHPRPVTFLKIGQLENQSFQMK